MDWRFLKKEEKALRSDPCNKEKNAGSYGEDQQRSDVVIVRLATQWAALFHNRERDLFRFSLSPAVRCRAFKV